MKSIAMITVHRTLNYGTMLQTYACAKIFKTFNYHTKLIDYHRKNDYRKEDFTSLRAFCAAKKNYADRYSLMTTVKSLFTYRSTKKFYSICDSFLRRNVELTKPYYSYDALQADPPIADLYCAGSDQIWNSDYNKGVNPAFFLDFAESDKKISFCSSIGKDELSEAEKQKIKSKLALFMAISVREDRAAEILSSMQLSSTSLIDPTLQLDRDFWAEKASGRLINEPYVLIYKLKSNDELDRVAHAIAKEKNLKIVRISFSQYKKRSGETAFVLPQIADFLSLMLNADYVVTNSFHGVCFSINFNRQFISVSRKNYNVRIQNILTKFGIEARVYSEGTPMEQYLKPIDYTEINKWLRAEREKATKWLKEVLK